MDIVQLYKQSLRAVEASYLQGKEDAFSEVLKYLLLLNKNADFRYVPIKDFIAFLKKKFSDHRDECDARNKATASYLSSLQSASGPGELLAHASEQVSAAIGCLEKQARIMAEDQGPLSGVQTKLNRLNFDIFKVKSSKKRRH